MSKLGSGTEERVLNWEPENMSSSLVLLLDSHVTY